LYFEAHWLSAITIDSDRKWLGHEVLKEVLFLEDYMSNCSGVMG